MTNIDWTTPRFIDLPDLRMAVFEAGQRSSTTPTIILCHGFPEIAYSWRHIMTPLANLGFHVVAPDLRGFGATGNPLSDTGDDTSVNLFDMQNICDDMAHLLDALGLEEAIFTGHDWGGFVVWQMPFYHPNRTKAVIGINTPFIPRQEIDPIEIFKAIWGEDTYLVKFQEYGVAEKILDENPRKTLLASYRSPTGSNFNGDEATQKMWKNFELLNILKSDETQWPGHQLLPDAEFQPYIDAFSKTGFRGGVNWYRNFTRNWELSENFPDKIDLPCLMICAEKDPVLPPAMADVMPEHIADLETKLIKNCGHWTQSEKPDELFGFMKDWLEKRFPV